MSNELPAGEEWPWAFWAARSLFSSRAAMEGRVLGTNSDKGNKCTHGSRALHTAVLVRAALGSHCRVLLSLCCQCQNPSLLFDGLRHAACSRREVRAGQICSKWCHRKQNEQRLVQLTLCHHLIHRALGKRGGGTGRKEAPGLHAAEQFMEVMCSCFGGSRNCGCSELVLLDSPLVCKHFSTLFSIGK